MRPQHHRMESPVVVMVFSPPFEKGFSIRVETGGTTIFLRHAELEGLRVHHEVEYLILPIPGPLIEFLLLLRDAFRVGVTGSLSLEYSPCAFVCEVGVIKQRGIR